MIRQTRAIPERQALGRRLRAHRLALGLTQRDIAEHIRTGKAQLYAAESGVQDITAGTLIDVAGALGLDVALVADHHLPLLDLTADEVDALHAAALAGGGEYDDDRTLRSALDKLTPPPLETTPSRPHVDEPRLDRPITTVHLSAHDIPA